MQNYTQLHTACIKGDRNIETIDRLLEINVDVNGRDFTDRTPLHIASMLGAVEVVKRLLELGADVNAQDNYGRTPAHMADTFTIHSAIKGLLLHGVNVNQQYIDDETRHFVCSRGDSYRLQVIDILLKSNADINIRCKEGRTGLHAASLVGAAEVVKRFLERGADVNAQDSSGNTPAHFASNYGHSSTLKVLLAYGANINLQNSKGETPLYQEYLERTKSKRVIDILLESNADINNQDSKGRISKAWILFHASYVDNVEMVKRLLARGADVNTTDSTGDTPAHVASSYGHSRILQLLLAYGANINLQNSKGRTPLHVVCYDFWCAEKLKMINILLQSNADVDIKCNQGNTALHIVSRPYIYRSRRIYKKLLENGALVDVKNNKGKTPYDLLNEEKEDVTKKTAIEKHIVKLKTAGIVVDIDLNPDLDLPVFKDIKNQCLQELEKLKMIIICNHFSLNTVLLISKKLWYLKNPEICQELEDKIYSKHFIKDFPLYGQILKKTYNKTKQRVGLLEKALGSFFSENRKPILSQKLPDLVKHEILGYLNNDDLKNLIDSA